MRSNKQSCPIFNQYHKFSSRKHFRAPLLTRHNGLIAGVVQQNFKEIIYILINPDVTHILGQNVHFSRRFCTKEHKNEAQ